MLGAMHTYVNDAIAVHRYTVSVSVIGPCFSDPFSLNLINNH